ncbi:beta/gamma crystallin domain-containing protein 2 isoform X3 [Spea bombifrons]|uniref:beta/gamma crystallin domain-containing protein 2 isoform X3 n=1 Tax=Spea bombifrons TaxID=233779 RepID=UPI0023498E08|nr:beta/gamma crystallin domain-containing protein 2 isoform X3 [Spea bombifrons]
MSSGVSDQSSAKVSSPTEKKKSLRKRLLKLFSKSESNLKEKVGTSHRGGKSITEESSTIGHAAEHVDKKGRHSWSEKRGKKDRHASLEGISEGVQSLPRLKHPKSEDADLRKTTRTSKTRSLSYSELELPASGFLQRFGSLTWRKKRFSATEYSDAVHAESSPQASHWSMGRLTVSSEIEVGNRRPRSCIVESHCSSPAIKDPKGIQRTYEVSTSFDCLADGAGCGFPSIGFSKDLNTTLDSSLTLSEKPEESMDHWAENILNKYLSPVSYKPQGSLVYHEPVDLHVLDIVKEDEEPLVFQSPLHLDSFSVIKHETYSQNETSPLCEQDIHPNRHLDCSSLCEVQTLAKQKTTLGLENKSNKPFKKHKSKYTIILTQEKNQKVLCHDEPQEISHEPVHNNIPTTHSPMQLINMVEEISTKKQNLQLRTSSQDATDNDIAEAHSLPLLEKSFKEGAQQINIPLYPSILGRGHLQDVCEARALSPKGDIVQSRELASAVTPKTRYEVIITMTKEQRQGEGEQVPETGGNMLREDELARPDCKLSPLLESQACGNCGVGPPELTSQIHLESQKQTGKDTIQEEEEVTHQDRSCDVPVEGCSLPTSGFEQNSEHYRFESPKMEKGNHQKNRGCSPYRNQDLRTLNTKKEHGKLNPRPGKIILFSEPGFRGQKYEIYSDLGNTSSWELQQSMSVRVIRGGWLLYEKPLYRGKRLMLLEGDMDLSCPWGTNTEDDTRLKKSWIGSLRHVVKDFQVPEISLFLEENGEGEKVKIVGPAPDTRVNGQPIKTESIIVHSGLWLLYSKPFFEGDPYILESGGYPNKKAWGGLDSDLCSLQPARIGGPTVEKPNEPKLHIFQLPGFEGQVWEVTRDLHSVHGEPNSNGERLTSVGSLKVLGGCWVAYEKEGFRGHQYLLEEGEFRDWSHWGGYNKELGSIRLIRTDFSEPEIVLYEDPGSSEGPCLRLSETLADVEVAKYRTKTGSIHVLSGVWVAYENVDFSGAQYILEKGAYHSFQDWGAENRKISSVQPVIQVGGHNLHFLSKIQLFSKPNFHGDCLTCEEDCVSLPESFSPQSCRVEGGSWILYEGEDCSGEQYIVSEGDYPTYTAMGCLTICALRSLRKVPFYFSVPSISLHGLERFEGKELEFSGEVRSLQGEGYNNHVLSVRVESGIWVVYEHSDFRGKQWLLERTQIPNWLLYSGLQRIGSLCPIRQRRVYFRLKNHALGLFLCVPESSEDMKASRVLLTKPKEGCCDLWYYEEGCIKNQVAPHMSLQMIGQSCAGTKVVLWAEGRKPIQTWSLDHLGYIRSHTFQGMCLDVKGGQSYDSDHVVVWEVEEDRPTQRWDIEVY